MGLHDQLTVGVFFDFLEGIDSSAAVVEEGNLLVVQVGSALS